MLSSKNLLRLLLLTNILVLISVYYIEYVMNVYACILCKYQRIPYFIISLLLIYLITSKEVNIKIIYLIIFCLMINIGLSFYHIGIEQNIFSETKACKATGSILNQEDLLKQFETNKIAGCANVNFRLLGMSLSSLNFIMNIVFLSIYAFIIKNEKK